MEPTSNVLEEEPGPEVASVAPAPKPPARPRASRVNKDAAKRLMERCIEDARRNSARLGRDRQDWQNLLLNRGGPDNHWTVWDNSTNSWVRRGTDPAQGGLPAWVPRCVTNVFASKISGICSILDQSEPAQIWKPRRDHPEDQATADVAEDAVPVLLEEIGYDAIRPRLNELVTLTDKAFLAVWYDPDEKYGTAPIPLFRCAMPGCVEAISPIEVEDAGGVCPECGGPVEDAIDERGEPMEALYPVGRMRADIVPGFEGSLPSSARSADTEDNPWVLLHTRMSIEEYRRRWPKAPRIDRHSSGWTQKGSLQRAYADAMAKLSSPYAAQNANAAGGGSAEFDGPVVYRLQHDPIVDKEAGFNFPDGLFAVMVDGEIIEATPLPVTDDRKHPIKSIITRSFTPVPNCPFNKPPGDDMAPLQIQRNMVETLTTLILMHDATPRTYIPLSVTLETEPTGMPGEPVYYRSTIPGERPQTDRGINPPEALYRHLEMIDEKFDEMSHLNAVLQGERPAGDPTLGEVQMLQERGMSAFRAPLSALVQFEKHLSRLLLWVAKDTAWAPRFRQVMGENSEWEIRQFSASDLGGEVDVMVEASSAWPKSLLMQQLRIKDAFAMGVFPPPAQDPELATKLTILMDLTDLKPSVDVDRKQITRELDRWKAARFPQEITPPDELMNLGLHLFLKGQFIKTEEAELLAEKNAPVYQAMRQHIMQLKQLLAPPPPPMPPPGKPGPEKTAREQGDNSAIDNAVQAGVLVPEAPAAPPQAPGAALGQMVDQGALVPEAVSTATGQPGVSIDDLITARALQPIDGNAVPVSSGPPPAAPPAMPGPMGPMPRRPGGPPQVQ